MKIANLQLILVFFTVIYSTVCSADKQLHIRSGSAQELRTSTKLALIRKQDIPELKSGQTVFIKNYYSKKEIIKRGYASPVAVIELVEIGTDAYNIDLRQITKTSKRMFKKAFKHRGVIHKKKGEKRVKLRAHSLKYNQGVFSADIEISVTAELGNNKSISATGKRTSYTNLDADASAALSDASTKILNHPDFIQYINQ